MSASVILGVRPEALLPGDRIIVGGGVVIEPGVRVKGDPPRPVVPMRKDGRCVEVPMTFDQRVDIERPNLRLFGSDA